MNGKVAVVAVHGVADQKPFETARSIAGLLQQQQGEGRTSLVYTHAIEEDLIVPIAPLPHLACEPDQADGRFTWSTLKRFKPSNRPYETIRIRLSNAAAGTRPVDVFEMYWADLSRLGTGLERFFGELYQLFFHLSRISVHTASAASCTDETRLWARYANLLDWTSIVFTNTVPAFNLIFGSLVGTVLLLGLVANYAKSYIQTITAIALGLIVLAVVTLSARVLRPRVPYALWLALNSIPFIAAAAGQIWIPRPLSTLALCLFATFITCAATALRRLGRRHRGVDLSGPVVVFGALGWYIVVFWRHAVEGIHSLIGGFAAFALDLRPLLVGAWTLILLGVASAEWYGLFLSYRPCHTKQERRAASTCRLTMTLPVLLFMLTTVTLWLIVLPPVLNSLPGDFRFNSSDARTFALQVLLPDRSVHLLAPVALLLGVAFALSFLWFLLIVLCETLPPSDDSASSAALGTWLSYAYRAMRFPGLLILIAGAWWPAMSALLLYLQRPLFDVHTVQTLARGFGITSASGLVGIIAIKSALDRFSTDGQHVLDTMLDVDNHLKQSPADEAPRAQIAERYHSLLTFLSTQGYTRIVFIAHSQGTVITADWFRYLFCFKAGAPNLPELRLFTMGSPLRQLYFLRFPHLYHWMHDDPQDPAAEPAPNPRELGVTLWVNAYRSGDYVGRNLWREGNTGEEVFCADVSTWDRRVEFCVGAGAHTHYWDGTAPAIGRWLQTLICRDT